MDDFKIKTGDSNDQNKHHHQKELPVAEAAVKPHDSISSNPSPKPPYVPPHKRLKWIFFKPEHVSRKKWLMIDAGIFLALIAAFAWGFLIYKGLTKTEPLPPQPAAVKREEKPTTEPSKLTGVQVDPSLNKRPVTGVMIENSPDARPQSGLLDAGVVIEAIAEGGITRFLALYQEAQPNYIGPVRSARPYYLDFALAFNASYAHVGGSPDALKQIKSLGIRDLDQFHNAGAYRRITQRYAPHNVYTSMSKLDALNKAKKYTSSSFESWPRKQDEPSKTPTAKYIDMTLSGFYYNTSYKYDLKTDAYIRSEGGRPHTDERSKKNLRPKVLIAMVTGYNIKSDGIHSDYRMTGSGTVYVFQDGNVTVGKWRKKSRSAMVTFTNAKGNPIKLNAGQTWITLLRSTSEVKYRK